MKATELAKLLNGSLHNAAEKLEITGISTLTEAGPQDVAFITDRKYLRHLETTRAGLILLPEKLGHIPRPHIALDNVWSGVLATLKHFYPGFDRREYEGIHPSAIIDPTAQIAADVTVGPLAVIGAETHIGAGTYIAPGVIIGARCTIGGRCTIYASAVIEAESVLGNGVYIQAGAVLGADGFKYEIIDGRWTKIPQVGHVQLADNAEVGANSCIDRASYSKTEIGNNTKIDNLVQIAHNAKVGNNCVIVSQSGIAGSTVVGDHVIFAAQSGVADNLKVGDRAVLMGRAGVTSDVPDGEALFGMPAIPFRQEAKIIAARKKLPDLLTQMTKLTARVAELEAQIAQLTKS